jgi:ppGpp synthetase/RelA/SpoT-type nucleotidyltranferase
MENQEIINKYVSLCPKYKQLSEKIALLLKEVLEIEKINTHFISNRAKEIESFSRKIENPKYTDPLNQVTDLAGIRIIVYVEDDVKKIAALVSNLFDIDSANSLDKSKELGEDRVGYKSVHFVCQFKNDRANLPEYVKFKNLKFEIQIRTILQHSWAEIEHDKNYKFAGELPPEIKRRFKLIAGCLEILDREFNLLSNEIDAYSEEVKTKTIKGDLKIDLNSTSLNQFLNTKFELEIKNKIITPDFNGKVVQILTELKSFGVKNLNDLDKIIPLNFNTIISQTKIFPLFKSFAGLLRTIMMANDATKYFLKAYDSSWTTFNSGVLETLEALGKSKTELFEQIRLAKKQSDKTS